MVLRARAERAREKTAVRSIARLGLSAFMADRVGRARRLLMRAVESLDGPGPSASTQETEDAADQPGARVVDSDSGSNRLSSVFTERNRLFNFGKKKPRSDRYSKKKKLSLWTHDFVCLNKTTCEKPPTSMQAGELMRAGLGRKSLSVLSFANSAELHEEILSTFPALVDGGGYELIRAGEGGNRNSLVVIPQPPEGYNVDYLKEVVRQAKVYIRPLQQDLAINESFGIRINSGMFKIVPA